jgi:hypothetical protein
MYAFERDVPESPLASYGAALWWTAMVMTTMGSDYFPRSAEGRALCVLLALFAFAVFGYVTATLATYFVGRDAAAADAEVAARRRSTRSRRRCGRCGRSCARSCRAWTSARPAPPCRRAETHGALTLQPAP